jgi:glycosyltransferase involved in cell wall biosynthesis
VSNALVSILLPAHHEGPRIFVNLQRVCAVAQALLDGAWRAHARAFEVVVIDDGSSDDTWAEITRAAAMLPAVVPVRLDHNAGKGWALRRGLQHARGEWIFFIDADLEIGPEHMADLAAMLLACRADGVLGSKRANDMHVHYPWYRRIVSITYRLLTRLLIPLPVRDTQTGFKLYTRRLLDDVAPRMLVRRYAFDIEMISIAHRLGYRLTQCPVQVEFSGKRGSVTIKNIYNMFLDTLAVFYRLRILKYYDSWRHKDHSRKPRVSIVIAVKGDNAYLRQSVAAVLKQPYDNTELIVLPDAPISGYDPRVRIIPTGPELPAIKRNIGAREATGEIIAFLDDDAYPYGLWLDELAANFNDPTVGAVGGPAVTPPEDGYWLQVSGAVYSSLAGSGAYRYRYVYDRRRDVDDYPTCNLAVRKSTFEAAQGFQSNYWPGEDTELCLTITKKLGARIVYDPQVEVYHHRRSLWRGHFKQVTQYALHRGYFVKKFPETSRRLGYFIPTLFTLGTLLGWLTWWLWPPLIFVYAGVLAVYVVFLTFSSFLAGPRYMLATMLGTFLTHLAYGLWFMAGLLAPRLSRREEQSGPKA